MSWRLLLLLPLLAATGCGLGALVGGTIAATDDSSSSAPGVIPAPTVTSVSPASGSHAGGFTVVIAGNGFPTDPANPPVVNIGGQQAVVVVDSPTQITASAPYSPTTGTYSVSVTDPNTGTGSLPNAFTFTNAAPTAAVLPLSTPQSQNVVFGITLQDDEFDPVNVSLEAQVNGGAWTPIPASQILSGNLNGLASTASGQVHNLTWDSRVMFPASNATNVILRVTPTDTIDGATGPAAPSSPFDIVNNTPVAISIVQPGDDEFDVALSFTVSDPDATDPVVVTAMTFTELNAANTGPLTITSGQGLGAVSFSSGGSTSNAVWDSLTDLGFGNSHLVQVSITVSDGTTSDTATSLPFFVDSGPLAPAETAPSGHGSAGFVVGDVAGSGRRRLVHGAVTGGPFLAEEQITGGTSGATAMVRKVGTDYLLIDSESTSFAIGETVTGGTSGASAPLTSLSTSPARLDVVTVNEAIPGERGSISELEHLASSFAGPRVTVAPDVPGPAIPGSTTNPFLSGFAHPSEAAVLDLAGDGLDDLVTLNNLDLDVATLLAHAGADAPAFANVIAHQALLEAHQLAGSLRVSSATYSTAQADYGDIAPHVRVAGQSATTYPPAPTGSPSMDRFGWFGSDLVAADLDTPGSPGAGSEDLVVLHQVRQLGSALGGDAKGVVVVRQIDPGTSNLGSTYYLDPTDMGIAATQAAVGDITADAHTLAKGGLPGDGRDVVTGTPDIIVANLGDSSLTFYLQIAAAVPPAAPTYVSCKLAMSDLNPAIPVGDTSSVAICDLNGDGKNDFVVLGQLTRLIYVFVHDPDPAAPGSLLGVPSTHGLVPFRLAGTLPLPAFTFDVRLDVGDVSGDGRADIVVPVSSTNQLALFANHGNVPTPPSATPTPVFGPGPGFTPVAVQFTTQFGPIAALTADLNSDGRLDAACLTFSQSVAVHHQVTPGTLDLLTPIPTGIGPLSVDAGDLTGDGIPEVITPCSGSNTLQIFQRDPGTTLALLQSTDLSTYQNPSPPVYATSLPYFAGVTDITGDGNLDVLYSLGTVLGPGSFAGGFGILQGTPLDTVPLLVQPSGIAAIDVRAGDFLFPGGVPDGIPDLAVSSMTDGVVLHQGLGGATFGAPTTLLTGSYPGMKVVDLDGDGYQDVIVADAQLGRLLVYYNGGHPAGSGTYGTLPATPEPLDALGLDVVVLLEAGHLRGSMNGPNPMLDLVVGDFTSANSAILFQTAPRVFSGVLVPTGDEAGEIAIGDLNNDGHLDLAVPWGGNDVLAVYYQNPAPTGLADTFFGPATYATNNTPIGATIVDVDGDGLEDVVVSCRGANVLNVFKQR